MLKHVKCRKILNNVAVQYGGGGGLYGNTTHNRDTLTEIQIRLPMQ